MNLKLLLTAAIFEFVFNIFRNSRFVISFSSRDSRTKPGTNWVYREFRTDDIVNIVMDLAGWPVEHVAVTEFKLKMISQNFNAPIVIKTVPLNAVSASNLLIFTR